MFGQRANRREFLGLSAASLTFARQAAAQEDAWGEVRGILQRIKAPAFPSRDFDITRYGAVGDGQKDCTEAIARAISECSRMGGGRVVAPRGLYATAAIHLKSNVNLHISKGATLRFLRDPRRYLPVVYT